MDFRSEEVTDSLTQAQVYLVEVGRTLLDEGERLTGLHDRLLSILCDEKPPAVAFRNLRGLTRLTEEKAEALLAPVLELLADYEVPAPVSLKTEQLPLIDPSLFPNWLAGQISEVAATTETPIDLAAGIALGMVAASVQGKLIIEVKGGYREPLNVWVAPTLGSGERKTAVLSTMAKPLTDWEFSQVDGAREEIARAESERATIEARIQNLRSAAAKAKSPEDFQAKQQEIAELEANLPEVPNSPRVWAQDVTPERLGQLMAEHGEKMTIASDEGGIFGILAGLYSNGIPNLDLFLQSHAGAPVRVDRGSRPPVMMRAPALTLALSPQPEVLRGLSSNRAFRGR